MLEPSVTTGFSAFGGFLVGGFVDLFTGFFASEVEDGSFVAFGACITLFGQAVTKRSFGALETDEKFCFALAFVNDLGPTRRSRTDTCVFTGHIGVKGAFVAFGTGPAGQVVDVQKRLAQFVSRFVFGVATHFSSVGCFGMRYADNPRFFQFVDDLKEFFPALFDGCDDAGFDFGFDGGDAKRTNQQHRDD